ncbi:hypothetical protein [Ammoniphilus sp. 3BR4]|uniref:hypothetical protein n=1 Tax=Ammoniphilus sp. 3BR4 TaxID=3158265 RepID=UPI0034667797
MSFAHFDEICRICCEMDEEPRFIRRFEHVDGFPEGILPEAKIRGSGAFSPAAAQQDKAQIQPPEPEDNAIYMIEYGPLV